MNNLEQDSLSDDPELNSEVSVLNKINATNVLTLRSVQDSNKLLASLLEQQTIAAKQQREMTTNAINADISRQASLASNLDPGHRHADRFLAKFPHAVAIVHLMGREGAESHADRFPAVHLQAINDLLTQNLGFFDAMGQNLFRMFATILIAWYGVKSALSAASGKYTFQFDNFASLAAHHRFGFAMVNYYSTPIPGIGVSFHNLVTDEAQFLANKINQAELQTIVDRIGDFEARIDAPGVTISSAWPSTSSSSSCLPLPRPSPIVVIAYGFIATAVCVLVGPIFVPFFIVPKLEWLFWGWFRCFLQYAFYQVIAAAVVYIIGNLILGVLTLQAPAPSRRSSSSAGFPSSVITFLASIYVLLKVPALTNHIFSGTAGGSSAGILEAPSPAAAFGRSSDGPRCFVLRRQTPLSRILR